MFKIVLICLIISPYFRIILTIMAELKPFLQLDPLLSYDVIYICPANDYPLLCNYVELNLVIDAIARELDFPIRKYNEVYSLKCI